MFAFVHKNVRRLYAASRGIRTALGSDTSFRLQFLLGLVFFAFGYLMRPLGELEVVSLTLAWILILITELQNTSFETALDRIHPEKHHEIGRSKDMAAGAVLLAGCFAAFVVIAIILKRIA